MDLDAEPPNLGSLHIDSIFLLFTFSEFVLFGLFLLLLIMLSGLISGSEIAYFSFSPQDEHNIDDEDSPSTQRIKKLILQPRRLLATILVVNNLVNIAIVIVSDHFLRNVISKEWYNGIAQKIHPIIGFFSIDTIASSLSILVTVILVTFILVLFGEVMPKIYANLNNIAFAKRMSFPLILLIRIFGPISSILVGWTNYIEKRVEAQKGSSSSTSKEDIDKAIDLATLQIDESPEQVDILKGILKFGDVSAKQIMKSRVDVVAISIDTPFTDLMETIKEHGYSRLPIYKEDFDELVGILYVKDLLGHAGETDSFNWQELIRENILYVPESKKIDELLKEFQSKRMHMGIVVDEYGGAAGIITLEDIMEEVIGDIKDEFDDEDEIEYVKLGEGNYIFEGKTLINDFCRIVDEDTEFFSQVQGDASSLAGLLLEMYGSIPKIDKEITYQHLKFKVISVSKKRIEKINVKINSNE